MYMEAVGIKNNVTLDKFPSHLYTHRIMVINEKLEREKERENTYMFSKASILHSHVNCGCGIGDFIFKGQ